MVGHVGVHRADDADVVDVLGGVREDLADFEPALAVLLRTCKGDGKAAPVRRSVRRFAGRQRLAGILGQRGLGVERIDLARPAIGEDVDDLFGLGRELRLLRARAGYPRRLGVGGEEAGLAHQLRQSPSKPMPTPQRESISRRDSIVARFGTIGALSIGLGITSCGAFLAAGFAFLRRPFNSATNAACSGLASPLLNTVNSFRGGRSNSPFGSIQRPGNTLERITPSDPGRIRQSRYLDLHGRTKQRTPRGQAQRHIP